MKCNWTKIVIRGKEKYFINVGRLEVSIVGRPGDQDWQAFISNVAHGEESVTKCGGFQTWDAAEAWICDELCAEYGAAGTMLDAISDGVDLVFPRRK